MESGLKFLANQREPVSFCSLQFRKLDFILSFVRHTLIPTGVFEYLPKLKF